MHTTVWCGQPCGQAPGSSPDSPGAPQRLPAGPGWPARCWERRWRCSPAPGTSPLAQAHRQTLPQGTSLLIAAVMLTECHGAASTSAGPGRGVALTKGWIGDPRAVQLIGAIGAVVPPITYRFQYPALTIPTGELCGAAGLCKSNMGLGREQACHGWGSACSHADHPCLHSSWSLANR